MLKTLSRFGTHPFKPTHMSRPPPTIHLTLDFDSTLTTHDTLLPLSHLGYLHSNTHTAPPPPWADIVTAYLTSLTTHTRTYPHPPPTRTTLAQESAWLGSLAAVEEASAKRAELVWQGVGREEVVRGAREAVGAGEVACRRGWEGVVGRVVRRGGRVEVVSVNWSRWWIWCCLRCAWGMGGTMEADERVLEEVVVYANELPSIEASMADYGPPPLGEATHLRTANDKLDCFTSLLERHIASLRNPDTPHTPTVLSIYIGDSTSDLLCLMDADIGICMRDETMGSGQKELEATCERLGVKVAPLASYESGGVDPEWLGEKSSDGVKKRLWWVTDFVAVETWLGRHDVAR